MQTGRQAIRNLFAAQPTDHVPLHDSPWNDALTLWTTQGMPVQSDGSPVDPVDHFGFEMASCGGWFDPHPQIGRRDVVEETAEWQIVRNGSGALLKWWKHKSGTPEHIDFAMTNRHIWETDYKPLLMDLDLRRFGDSIERSKTLLARRQSEGRWTYYGHLFVWENMRAAMGDQVMFMTLLDDPEWVHDYCRTYTDLWKQAFAVLIEQAGRPDGIWIYEDLGYRDRLFCDPKILETLIFPYYAELVEFFHGYNLPVVFHSCGYQKPMLPLAVAAGFDGLNPMEVKAGNNIVEYARAYGENFVFVGGFNAQILETGDRPLIKREVQRFIRDLKDSGARFLYGSDHSVSTAVNYRDFVYSLDVYREEMLR